MKKIIRCLLALSICFGLSACGSKSLKDDIGEEKAKVIEKTLEELKTYFSVSPEYKEGNKEKGSATFVYGDCEMTFVTDGQTITQVSVKDNAPNGSSSSEDFKDTMSSVSYLSVLDLDSSTLNKIVENYNAQNEIEENWKGYVVKITKTSITINNKTKESIADSIPVTLEDIEMVGFKCLPPNSIGTIYMETKFKNNSDKILEAIQYVYVFDDKKHYLSCYDTLLPGETSTKVDTFGPESKNLDDIQLLEVSFTVKEDGKSIYVDYDAKLKEYSWY